MNLNHCGGDKAHPRHPLGDSKTCPGTFEVNWYARVTPDTPLSAGSRIRFVEDRESLPTLRDYYIDYVAGNDFRPREDLIHPFVD